MNIKKHSLKAICAALVCTTLASSMLAAFATDAIITETPMDDSGDMETGGSNWTTEENRFEEISVTYQQAASYFVTIPKTIALGTDKQAAYAVRVTGDIDTKQRVYVAPVDEITGAEEIDFYMKEKDNKKEDVVATVTQNKTYWSFEDVANGHEEANNSISAPDLTAGTWEGTFQMEIRLETEKEHEHNYVDGECECGAIDPCVESHTDENEDGICDICGHEHQWVENEDVLEWTRYNPYGQAQSPTGWTKNGNTWTTTFNIDKTDATKSASIDFDIDVPNDVECTYSFTCPYLYKTDFQYYDNTWAFLYDLDDAGNKSTDRITVFDKTGAGSGNSSGKISLSKGKHRLSVLYHKGNKTQAISGTVSITLEPINALNYVCTECGEKKSR